MTSPEGLITIASMVQYLFIGELLIFSLCLIIIQIRTRVVYTWLFSNVVGLFGVFLTLPIIETNEINTKVTGGAIVLLSSAIKAICYSGVNIIRNRNRIPNIFLILSLICISTIFIIPKSNYQFIISISCSIFLSFSAIFYLIKSRLWIGLYAAKYILLLFYITILPLICLIFTAYPIGDIKTFVIPEKNASIYIILQSILIFFVQFSFIGLVIGRNARENLFILRRSIRAREVSIKSKMREQESAALADERYHLLKMLTHEVRQPMNSAQAALQALTHKIGSGVGTPDYMQKTLESASSTLNAIILSISNSILGATLITKGRVQSLEVTDICCVVQLALLDIDQKEAKRFEKKFDQPIMFADADPIILRLGIRNLLENAVKYSPRHSKIFLNVDVDDERLTLVIRVTNDFDGSAMLEPDIFNQARRGVDKKYEGYGLGLYIAKEVAKLHRGSLSCYTDNGKTVTFELAIPA